MLRLLEQLVDSRGKGRELVRDGKGVDSDVAGKLGQSAGDLSRRLVLSGIKAVPGIVKSGRSDTPHGLERVGGRNEQRVLDIVGARGESDEDTGVVNIVSTSQVVEVRLLVCTSARRTGDPELTERLLAISVITTGHRVTLEEDRMGLRLA